MENKLTSVFFNRRNEILKIKTFRNLVFLICITIFGLLPYNAAAQSAKIKIDQNKSMSVDEIFNLIMSQTSYIFIYQVEQFKNYPKVNLEKGSIQTDVLLKKALSQGNFNYSFNNNTIVVSELPKLKEKSEINISGKVTDAAGLGIPGITVYVSTTGDVKGEKISKDFLIRGTATDFDGSFSLKAETGNFIYAAGMGFEVYTERITGAQKVFNIKLREKASELEQVLVVGYGTTKKKDLTGSVGSVKAEEIAQIKTQSIDQALGGRVSGVYVSALNGRPGSSGSINIRGLTDLRGDNQPLYVVDGVPIQLNPSFEYGGLGSTGQRENPLMAINPNDVERVDILKDASAAAIYGSRASKGVVIITTKHGKKGQKPQFTFTANSTFQNPTRRIDFLSADQFRAFNIDLAQKRIDAGTGSPDDQSIVAGTYYGNANTDWQKEISNQNALWNDYRFSLSGGSDKVTYMTSGNVTDQEGMLIGSKLKRYTFSANVDANVTDHLKIGTSINYNNSINKSSDIQGLLQGDFRPDLPVFDENGEYTTVPALYGVNPTTRNPVGGEGLASNKTLSQNVFGTLYAEIEIIEGLKFKSLLSAASNSDETSQFDPSFSRGAVVNPISGTADAVLSVQHNRGYSTSFSNTLSYIKTFESGHRIDAVAGVSWDQSRIELAQQNYAGFPDDFILTNIGSANRATTFFSEAIENGLNSLFGRVNYSYKDRYLATFTARRDGSTKFGTNNQYGFFPSGALAWNVHNEEFFKNDVMSQLKLRASLGKTGSDNLGSFSYLAYLSSLPGGESVYADINGIAINSLPNLDIRWEETTQLDIAAELGFFNNRLTAEVGYFSKKTSGIILYTPVPAETGTSSYNSNVADVSNKGWEVTVGGDIIRGKDFRWNSSFNISFIKNNVDRLNGGSVFAFGNISAITEGQPIGVIMGYDVLGIAQNQAEIDALNTASPTGTYYQSLNQPGDFIYKDVNGDGKIDTNDIIPLGSPNPTYFGGWNNTISYKNFDFGFNFQYQQGAEKLVTVGNFTNAVSPGINTTTLIYDTWTPENPDAKYARVGAANELYGNSRHIGDASYIRLRSASIGYNFPSQWLKETGISNIRLSLLGNNLFVISNYIGGDPESVFQPRGGSTTDLNRDESFNYPLAKTITVGLNVTF
ncbi:SusC/RagA family TonB-linked outer membrane protein [Flavobacterium saccharophilum]|uniref:TonB-linked outer membrane protein, SusC/RagA family n=1 Tax=Flavobacterium saccharophilum TaxID=29534 RepID=A0A1M7FU77_9FLAO|nr:TonB-dependent receptor [Flavobacterium saccharophilum]SHM07237.1 TonB-linked outer membrane protein, SusC/RagA family [Flavobacterium saccharophilum]